MFTANLTFGLAFLLLVIIVLLAIKIVKPLLLERKRGRNLMKVVDGLKPHWLFGHMLAVSCFNNLRFELILHLLLIFIANICIVI